MKNLNGILFLFIFAVAPTLAIAEIKIFQANDNSGLNKKERIYEVEAYLVDLSNTLRAMENKLDENSKKIKALDDVVKAMKEAEAKKAESQLGEKRIAPSQGSEMDKLKADVLALKNHDIEKLKINFEELNDTVKAIQASIRSQQKN
ncbi:MAG: hypothetical protein ACXVLQ_01945 [Bacteriovorax sp.]